ncbi:MAG: hypothetical protein Q9195_001158 [Heterodermia aff. obscurata]
MADDGCSYYEPHQYWSENRADWPTVLFQYEPDISVRGRGKPGQLITREGWLVLDLNSKPVKNFRAPLALSSKPEPYLVEAIIRENYDLDMQVQDIRARMPGVLVNGVDRIRTGTICMAINRFRMRAGLISWSSKIGSDAMKDYLDALLPPICLATNSTRPFRNLHPHEVEEMKLINAGCYPNKARAANRDYSDANKQKIFHKAAEKYRTKRKAFDGSTQFTPTFYKVQQVRAQREGRSYSDSGEDDWQDSDAEDSRDAGEEEDNEEELDRDITPDADYHQAPAPDPAAAETVIDFRNLRPTTYLQIDLISMMLEPSRLQFFYITGTTPPPASSSETYLTQHTRLQSALDNEIVKAGVGDYNGVLIGLTDFTDKLWTWNGPWCAEAFGTEPELEQVERQVLAVKQELVAAEAETGGALEAMEVGSIQALDFSIADDG